MGTKQLYLESRVLDKKYAHPWVREVKKGDLLEFIKVDVDFDIIIPNQDGFLLKDNGNAEVSIIIETFNASMPTKTWKVNPATDVPWREFTVCLSSEKLYADSPGNSPPKIIIVE